MAEDVGGPLAASPAADESSGSNGSKLWPSPATFDEVVAEVMKLRRFTWALHKRVCALEGSPVTRAARGSRSRRAS